MSEPQTKPGRVRIVLKVIMVLWLIVLAAWLLYGATLWLVGWPRWG